VQTNIFPLYEIEDGTRYKLNYKGDCRVEDYLETQGRFKHLSEEDISQIQGMVTEDWNNLVHKAAEVPS
jgi:pyruvate/2-oxoacid:ferredoxin oxidoreductase beta subunit